MNEKMNTSVPSTHVTKWTICQYLGVPGPRLPTSLGLTHPPWAHPAQRGPITPHLAHGCPLLLLVTQ